MAYVSRSKKSYRRRRSARRRRPRVSKRVIRSNPLKNHNGFPKSYTSTHRYVTEVSLNGSATGIGAINLYSANGMYDPDVSGIGHQPMGFDELSSIYDHYCVIGSKIKITPYITGTSVQTKVYFAVYLQDSTITTHIDNFTNAQEQQKGKFLLVGQNNGVSPQRSIYKTFNLKYFGSRGKTSNSTLNGDAASNPLEQAYFAVAAYGVQATDPLSVQALVEIDYITVWTEKRMMVGS